MSVPIKLVTVRATGKRFLFLSENKGRVYTKGEVYNVSGCAASYGRQKTFLRDYVDIYECELSEELLKELEEQDKIPTLP